MLTGSLVSSLQGEPRSTHDIDLVVALPPEVVSSLATAFPPPEYFLDEISAETAVRRGEPFNLLEVSTGEKVDFWPLTSDPFDQSRFARRELVTLLGVSVCVSRPEDTILQKLRWAKLAGGSQKQFGDALGVYEVQSGRLDQAYLDRWAELLSVSEMLARLRLEAEPL